MSTATKRARRALATSARGRGQSPAKIVASPVTSIAKLAALGGDGEPWIAIGDGRAKPRRARTIVALDPSAIGREVLVCFTRAGVRAPVVLGVLWTSGDRSDPGPPLDLVVNRRRLVLAADEEVVIRCGPASITLTANGKVVVQGADLVSSAKRINRIRGGAVRIN